MGWSMFLSAGVAENWFTTTSETAFDAVFYSDFEQFVHLYALKQAKL